MEIFGSSQAIYNRNLELPERRKCFRLKPVRGLTTEALFSQIKVAIFSL